MSKLLWVFVAALLVIVSGGAWWLYRSLDSVVATAIRTYGPEITGVQVKLGGVNIQPANGMASLRALELGNPAGFRTARALSVGTIRMQLDVASLTKEVVLIKEMLIEQPEVTYEHSAAGNNLEAIQHHVEAYVAGLTGTKDNPKALTHPKRLIIDHLYIKGARTAVSADALNGKTVTLVLPDLHLTDIGKKTGGVTPAEATRLVIGSISQSVAKAVLPLNLGGAVDSIKRSLSNATDTVKRWFK